MVRLIEVEVEGEEDEANEAEGTIKAKGPEEEGMSDHSGDVGGVDDRRDEGHCKVGGEEMGFVEAVEENDESHLAERSSLRAVDVFIDVWRSKVAEVRVIDPPRNTVCRAARELASPEKLIFAVHTRMLLKANSTTFRHSSSTGSAAPSLPHTPCPKNPTCVS